MCEYMSVTRIFLPCLEIILVHSDICEQSKPLWVGKIIRTGEVLLTEEGDDILLQVTWQFHDSTSGPQKSKAGHHSVR